MKNINNTWKGIKWINSLKAKDLEYPKTIKTKNGETITDPKLIADNFLFVCLVAKSVQEKIAYAFKPFQNYLTAYTKD